MEIIISVLAFLVLIALVITIHEGGQFVVGRLCGMRMLEFSIGFGPRIFETRFGRDQTKFTLRLLPLGGYVKPLDPSMVKPEEWASYPPEEQKRAYTLSARWKKTLMVAGGPFCNFVLAFVVYFIAMAWVGTHGIEPVISEVVPNSVFAKAGVQEGDKILKVNGNQVPLVNDAYPMIVNGMLQGRKVSLQTQRGIFILDYTHIDLKNIDDNINETMGAYFKGESGDVVIRKMDKDGSGAKAGIQTGDILKSVNGKPFSDVNRAIRFINSNPGKELTFDILRNNQPITLKATPELKDENGRQIGRIGIEFEVKNKTNSKLVRYSLGDALWLSTQKVWDSSYTTIMSVKRLVTGELSTKSISGPLAIADYSGKSAQIGLFQYLMMIGAISIAVGVFNLIPIPALDGGHIAQYLIEWVIDHDINPKIIHYGQVIGFGLLMGVFFLSMFNDISKYFF